MKNTRDRILAAVAMNKPADEELPVMDFSEVMEYEDVCRQFMRMVENAGGRVVYLDSRNLLLADIEDEVAVGNFNVNLLKAADSTGIAERTASELAGVHKCYLKSGLGVAENGAIWLGESVMQHRLLPFICQHLIVVLNPETIVSTMHDAYRRINLEEGFGVFIAGPSKTADIEQSLVIGAHGARSMTIYLIENCDGIAW